MDGDQSFFVEDEDFDYSLALMLQEQLNEDEYDEKKVGGLKNEKIFAQFDEKHLTQLDEDFDYSLALMLQEQMNEVENKEKKTISTKDAESSKKGLSCVDPMWETIDPNPNIHQLFVQFNKEFFWGTLDSVEVRWSSRMTVCAGICCYEGRKGLCSVRLSQPLLKFRPRSDLVETLLHEMIHAYLFITRNNKDHDGHGPEFLKHMSRINQQTGAKISVYHSFHDEVDYQRQHWWQCNGPCRNRKPYFGILKRAMNRAPSPQDSWWANHQATCGGVFVKIREPTKKKNDKPKAPSGEDPSTKSIKTFFAKSHPDTGQTSSTAQKIDPIKSIVNTTARVSSIGEPNKTNGFVPFSGKSNILGRSDGASNPATRSRLIHQYSGGLKDKSSSTKLPKESSSQANETRKLGNKTMKIPTVSPVVKMKRLEDMFAAVKTGSPKPPLLPVDISPTKRTVVDLIDNDEKNNHGKIAKKPRNNETGLSSGNTKDSVMCPVCSLLIKHQEINIHLDMCLKL